MLARTVCELVAPNWGQGEKGEAGCPGVGEWLANHARRVVPGAFKEVLLLLRAMRCSGRAGRAYDCCMTEATPHDGNVKSAEMGDLAGISTDSEIIEVESAPSAVEMAEAWLAELVDQMAVSASDVQDHLLDLWGLLDEGPGRSEIERWLTETLARNLYSVADINDRLETVLPAS